MPLNCLELFLQLRSFNPKALYQFESKKFPTYLLLSQLFRRNTFASLLRGLNKCKFLCVCVAVSRLVCLAF